MLSRPQPGEPTNLAQPGVSTPQPGVFLAWLLVLGGGVGSVAAFVLVLEKISLLRDSAYVPSCSINPVLNCGSVMRTPQAELLGFPNPLIGLALFPVVVATGVALLAGARLARWYWTGLQVGVTLGLAFVCWLIFQSLYRINALCPYCMAVWAVVLPIFCYVTLHNMRSGVWGQRVRRSAPTRWFGEAHALVVTLLFTTVALLVLERFWSYWVTLV